MAMQKQENLGLLLKKINVQMKKNVDADMQEMDLTFIQHHVLTYLKKCDGYTATLKELEKNFSVAQSTMAGIVNRLEERGFVASVVCEEDKRVKKIQLTDLGLEICDKSLENMNKREKELSRLLSAQERKELIRMLNIIYDDLKKGDEHDKKISR